MSGANNAVRAGDDAPDSALTDISGNVVRLSDFWRDRPVVLVFLRHFGCPFCREQIARLRADYARFTELGAEIVCIGMGNYKVGKAFSILMTMPFPMLVSGDDNTVYNLYSLGKAGLGQIFSLSAFKRGLLAFKNGHRSAGAQGDVFQSPGVFVIDQGGKIVYAHHYRDIGDNPDNALLLDKLQELDRNRVPAALGNGITTA